MKKPSLERSNADIRKGDTLGDPQHTSGGELMSFDRVIANPPFSLKKWGKEAADADPYGRYPYGTPPKDAGDLAFIQHMIARKKQRYLVPKQQILFLKDQNLHYQ